MLYDPKVVSFESLLRVFLDGIDPYYQGYSRQYQSVAFYTDDSQRAAIEREVARLTAGGKTVRMRVEPLGTFTQAEDYHQKHDLRMFGGFETELSAKYGPQWLFTTAATRANGFLGGSGTCGELRAEIGGLGLPEPLQRTLLGTVCQSEATRPGETCPVPARK